MFDVCPACGEYSEDKAIDPAGPYAVCPRCGYRHRFLQLPLYVVTGASGAGKTALCLALAGRLTSCVVLESDILWGAAFATPDDNYRGYLNTWLRMAKNIGQSGRPVALFGTATPGQLEICSERRYFATVHYLALVCDDQVLAGRLHARPGWRQSATPAFVASMLNFNHWLKDNAATTAPPMMLFETSACTLEDSAGFVERRITERL